MKLKIKRIDKSLSLPTYEKGASCFDLICRQSTLIKPGEIRLVPVNTVIKIPEGFTLLIFPRSSTPIKKGLMLANNVGVVDSFYSGDKDEIILELFNFTNNEVEVKRGEMLAQGIVMKHEMIEWEEVEKMEENGRGGYTLDLNRPDKR